jgi:8-amino-7-oxononanoate synthase
MPESAPWPASIPRFPPPFRRSPTPGCCAAPGACRRGCSISPATTISACRFILCWRSALPHEYGVGAGASRLVTGTLEAHARVEAKIAAAKKTEAALLFASGWQANASVLASLLRFGKPALVFCDWLNHASLHHACRAAGVAQIRYRHNDMAHLAELLEAHEGAAGRRFIVTESVFSMDGDRADLPALRELPGAVDLAMGTFSKALGGFGAYVAGSRPLCDWLVNRASGFIHTTALPPTVLGAIDAALDLVPGMDTARLRLHGHAQRLREALRALGIQSGPSSTQIVPAIVGDEASALELAARLRAEGLLAVAIRPPTVPAGTSRLRLALSAAHSEADVSRLIAALSSAWPKLARAA